MLVAAIIGILAALLLPAVVRAIRNSKITKCASNLGQLYKSLYNYSHAFGGRNKLMPETTCGGFWIALEQTSPPVVDASLSDIFRCPLEGTPNPPGTTDFRGPQGNINLPGWGDKEPIGADKVDNHGPLEGGNVIRKGGDVQTVPSADPLWTLANAKTCP